MNNFTEIKAEDLQNINGGGPIADAVEWALCKIISLF